MQYEIIPHSYLSPSGPNLHVTQLIFIRWISTRVSHGFAREGVIYGHRRPRRLAGCVGYGQGNGWLRGYRLMAVLDPRQRCLGLGLGW